MSYFDANPREALEIVADLEKNCPHPKTCAHCLQSKAWRLRYLPAFLPRAVIVRR